VPVSSVYRARNRAEKQKKKTWRFVSVDPDRAGKRKDNAIAGTQNPDAYPAARYYRTLL